MRIARRIQVVAAASGAVVLFGSVGAGWVGGASHGPMIGRERIASSAYWRIDGDADGQGAPTRRALRHNDSIVRAVTVVHRSARDRSRDRMRARERDVEVGIDEVELALYSAERPADDALGSGGHTERSRSIELLASREAVSGSSIRIHGRDSRAPRPLWLWRIEAGGAALFARGASLENGSLDFASAIVPRAGLELIATPAGGRPSAGDASGRVRIEARPPHAPMASVTVSDSGARLLRVVPREPAADIVLADASGRELVRFAARGLRAFRGLEIALDEFSGEAPARIAHVLPNGRRSDWRSVETRIDSSDLE